MRNKEEKRIVIGGGILSVCLSFVCGMFHIASGILCLILGITLTAIFYLEARRYNQKLERLNQYLSLVCSGNYDLRLEENQEGELSILSNNLYKVISTLRTQKEMLEKDKVYLADALADITHQLKSPLTSMTMMTDLLQEEVEEENTKEMLEVIASQLAKMRWLILNLLKMSKLDAGTTQLKREEVQIWDVIRESQAPFLLAMELKKIQIVDKTQNFIFHGDKNWTVEAVSNMIKNCIEHMQESGKLILETQHTNLYEELVIQDDGCGISAEDLPHIFERFYRGKNSSPESVGIGLALAKTILEKERAEIFVESEEGNGTRFVIRFYHALI